MNEKYKKLMEKGSCEYIDWDAINEGDKNTGSSEAKAYRGGFTACYEEMQKDLKALERKLEVAKDILEYSSAQLVLFSKDKSWSHLDFALSKMQEALADIKGE